MCVPLLGMVQLLLWAEASPRLWLPAWCLASIAVSCWPDISTWRWGEELRAAAGKSLSWLFSFMIPSFKETGGRVIPNEEAKSGGWLTALLSFQLEMNSQWFTAETVPYPFSSCEWYWKVVGVEVHDTNEWLGEYYVPKRFSVVWDLGGKTPAGGLCFGKGTLSVSEEWSVLLLKVRYRYWVWNIGCGYIRSTYMWYYICVVCLQHHFGIRVFNP